MAELETVTGKNWRDLAEAPLAVLVLGKSDCENCQRWADELIPFLATTTKFADVRFGKMLLDTPGLADFKKNNSWIADLSALPYNVIYQNGERVKEYAGGGLPRLENRLRRLQEDA